MYTTYIQCGIVGNPQLSSGKVEERGGGGGGGLFFSMHGTDQVLSDL